MLILYRYIWLVYVYFVLSADFDYPRQFSPPLPRIIEILLYLYIAKLNIRQLNDHLTGKHRENNAKILSV
jgi:hypothetical protein